MTWSRRIRIRVDSIAAERWRLPICQPSSIRCDRILPENLVERLLGRRDDDLAAILDHQPVVGLEYDRLGQVHQHLAAVDEFDGAPAQVPLVMRQHRPPGRLRSICRDLGCPPDGDRPQHAVSPHWPLRRPPPEDCRFVPGQDHINLSRDDAYE